MQASPPTQDEDEAQEDEGEDQEVEPPQEESNDQGGDAHDQDKEDEQDPRPPHPRVHQAIQRDHPVNTILGDIQKGDIEIAYINTKEQLADIFTKPLDEQTFTKLRHELNILDSRNFD
jgi:hypothetical protein